VKGTDVQKYLCKIGLHKYVSINLTDCFTTSYTDRNWLPTKHVVWYQQCSCCGKRRLKEHYKKEKYSSAPHAGIEAARLNWETYGVMYLGKGKTYTLPPTAPRPTKTKLKVVEGGKNG
jgi:hypothetical protein